MPNGHIFWLKFSGAHHHFSARTQGSVFQNGMKTSPDLIVLTGKGRQFLNELGLRDL
jgi:hypothetical protein